MIKTEVVHVPGDTVTGTIIANNKLVINATYNYRSGRWVLKNVGGTIVFNGQRLPPTLKIHKKVMYSSTYMIAQFTEEHTSSMANIVYVQGQLDSDAIHDHYPTRVFNAGMNRLKALKLMRDIVAAWEKMRLDMLKKEEV